MQEPAILATHEWPAAEVEVVGPVPIALLIHGLGGSWETWWRVGPALAERGWRAVAIDLRGHGDSPPIEGTVMREELAFDLAETITSLDLQLVDVVIGHSLGAAVTIELAHAQPELLRRIVLEDPPGTDRRDDEAFIERFSAEVRAAREEPHAETARVLAENPTWLPEDGRVAVDGLARCDLDGLVASLRHGMGSRVVELAPILTVPALYLLADERRSAIWGEERAALLAGVPADSRVAQFDCGHVIHRDRFDDYLATVLDWLGETERS